METSTVRNDLRNYESFAKLNSDESGAFFAYQKVNATNDLNIKLREELQRCLSGTLFYTALFIFCFPFNLD